MNVSEQKMLQTFFDSLYSGTYSYRAKNFAKVFMSEDDMDAARQNNEKALKKGRIFLDCLYGKRPDMQIKIWDVVLKAIDSVENYEVRMSMLDNKIIEHSGMDLGTIILLRLIAGIAESSDQMSSQVFSNHENNSLFSVFMSYDQEYAYIYIDDYSLDDNVAWAQPLLVIPQMPQIVEAQLRGRKLTDIISHPAFNEMDITITNTYSDYDDLDYLVTDLHTDYTLSKETTFSIHEYASQEIMRLSNN